MLALTSTKLQVFIGPPCRCDHCASSMVLLNNKRNHPAR